MLSMLDDDDLVGEDAARAVLEEEISAAGFYRPGADRGRATRRAPAPALVDPAALAAAAAAAAVASASRSSDEASVTAQLSGGTVAMPRPRRLCLVSWGGGEPLPGVSRELVIPRELKPPYRLEGHPWLRMPLTSLRVRGARVRPLPWLGLPTALAQRSVPAHERTRRLLTVTWPPLPGFRCTPRRRTSTCTTWCSGRR
jgi:hypothetical protein